MKISGWIGSIGWLAIASCGQQVTYQSAPTTAVVVSPSVAVSPAATPQAAQAPAGSIAVPPAPSVLPVPDLPVPDLIAPTSATARVPQIDAGRSNPYATVAVTPRVTAAPRASVPTVAVQSAASARSTPAAASGSPTVTRPAPHSNSNPVAIHPAVNPLPPQAVPARPTAELARSIAVSGVVQTSGQTSAIVQVPQEGSRYVNVGDRLAGGRVLVKRIEAGADEAIVVFEQDGVEVSRSVSGSGVL